MDTPLEKGWGQVSMREAEGIAKVGGTGQGEGQPDTLLPSAPAALAEDALPEVARPPRFRAWLSSRSVPPGLRPHGSIPPGQHCLANTKWPLTRKQNGGPPRLQGRPSQQALL